MKRLVLIKQSSAIQLGHLYEHIFCAQLTAFLHERRLFPHLDYSLTGKMYYGGVLFVDIEFYTNKAMRVYDEIASLPIRLNDEILSTAIRQMIAEKETLFLSTGYEAIKQALELLHAETWQNIDEVKQLDTKNIRKKRGSFYLADSTARPARKLTIGVFLDAAFATSHRAQIPLFRQFAWLITASLQEVLANTYGYYSLDDAYSDTKDVIGITNRFNVAYADDQNVDISDILTTSLEVIHTLRDYDAFDRLAQELHETSYRDRPASAPNLEKNYEDIHIFIGSKGWQEIAGKENYALLLEHMSIEVRFGRSKVSEAITKKKAKQQK